MNSTTMNDFVHILSEMSAILETSDGRDKVLRCLCYISKLSGTLTANKLYVNCFHKFSVKMSSARNIVQLLNDIPMLKRTIDYGFGQKEPELFLSAIGVLTNLVDHIGYTIEKVTWLSETKLINLGNHQCWEVANSVCKIISISLTFMRTLRYIMLLRKKTCSNQENEKWEAYEGLEWFTLIRLLLDFTHAVNSLPAGFLWSGKFNTLEVSIIGTVSSILAVTQLFFKRTVYLKFGKDAALF